MLVTVEGHHDGARDEVLAAVADIEALIRANASPVSVRAGLVDRHTLAFERAD